MIATALFPLFIRPDLTPARGRLSRRQRRILDMVVNHQALVGYPPSMREIGAVVGLKSAASVAHQLRQIEAKGWVRRDPARPRAIEVLAS